MTVTTTSEDERIECFYDANEDKDNFDLTVPTENGCFVTVKINRLDTDDLINTLKRHDEVMRLITGGRTR